MSVPRKMNDNVNHPDHYKASNGMEVIDVIDAFTSDLIGFEAAYTSNIIKYILRWNKKNGLEDLKKARWYLDRLIQKIENKSISASATDAATNSAYMTTTHI